MILRISNEDDNQGTIYYNNGWRWTCFHCPARSKPNVPHAFASGAAKSLFLHIEQKHPEKIKP